MDRKDWISLHIFYYGDQNYLLVECIKPLMQDLQERGLIQRYFFIRYWLEGYHIRLRLLPAPDADSDKLKYIAEQAINTFLQRRPALYMPDTQFYFPYQREQFILEYGEEKLLQTYGEQGLIPLRPNNTFAYIPYEPEYHRYGGIKGVELAEWHFEHSSDMVLKLLEKVNVTVQSILLGLSLQLTLPFFFSHFTEDEAVISALEAYMSFWQEGFFKYTANRKVSQYYTKKYNHMSSPLRQRVAQIRQSMLDPHATENMTPLEQEWISHIRELRQKMQVLFAEEPFFTDRASPREQVALHHNLQGSYVHMTNNRLGVSIEREIYLTYLLAQALKDIVPQVAQEVVR